MCRFWVSCSHVFKPIQCGATAITTGIGWGVGLILFIALTRSSNPRLHEAVVAFAWLLLIAEYIFELMRGVPTL